MKTRKNNKNKTKQKQNKIVLKKKSKTQNNKKNRKNRKTVSLKKVQKGGGWERPYDPSRHLPASHGLTPYERRQQKKKYKEEIKRVVKEYRERNKNIIKAEKFEEYKLIAKELEKNEEYKLIAKELEYNLAAKELSAKELFKYFSEQSELYDKKKRYFSMGSNQKRENQREALRDVLRNKILDELESQKTLDFDTYKNSERENTEYIADFDPVLFEPGELIFIKQAYRDLNKKGDRGFLHPAIYDALSNISYDLKTIEDGNPYKLKKQEVILIAEETETEGKGVLYHANLHGDYDNIINEVFLPPSAREGESDYIARIYHDFETPLPILLKETDLYRTEGQKKIKKLISDTVINIDSLPSPPNSNMGGTPDANVGEVTPQANSVNVVPQAKSVELMQEEPASDQPDGMSELTGAR